MSFKRAFERNVNKQMREDGRSKDSDVEDTNIKKHHDAPTSIEEEEDHELSEKKDRPPRFSTIFAGPPAPVPYTYERDPPREKKRSGVFIPMPIFIMLAALFFLLLTFIFAYTIIGLYNNRPYGLLSTPVNGCNYPDKQAGINIAPNFVMPGQSTMTVTVTATKAIALPDSQTSPTNGASEVNAESTRSTTTSTRSTTTTTFTPKPIVTTSTAIIAVDGNGNTIVPAPTKPTTTAKPADDGNNDDDDDGFDDVRSAAESALNRDLTFSGSLPTALPAPSQADTPSPTDKPDDAATSTKTDDASGTNGACFGGSGAVVLNCVDLGSGPKAP